MQFCPKCGQEGFSRNKDKPYRIICSNCGYRLYDNPAPAAAAIVQSQGKIVVVQHRDRPSLWGLPGGFAESNESLEAAVIREVREETGLVVDNLIYVKSYPTRRPGRDVLFIVFAAEHVSGTLIVGDELLEVILLKPKEAYKKITGVHSKDAVGLWFGFDDNKK